MIGAFGFYPQVLPGPGDGLWRRLLPRHRPRRAISVDQRAHALTLKVSRISEMQNLQATYAQGVAGQAINAWESSICSACRRVTGNASSNPMNYSDELQGLGGLCLGSHDQRHGRLFQRARNGGRHCCTATPCWACSGPSAYGSPDGKGLIFDIAYMPFSKGSPGLYPWANAKIGLSYTHYLQLYGGTTNFDGLGTYYNGSSWRSHTATDNNTLFLYTWIAF